MWLSFCSLFQDDQSMELCGFHSIWSAVGGQATEPTAFPHFSFLVAMIIISIYSGLIKHQDWYKIALHYGQFFSYVKFYFIF